MTDTVNPSTNNPDINNSGINNPGTNPVHPITVPQALLGPPTGLSPSIAMYIGSVLVIAVSCWGYWVWEFPHWLCFALNVVALHVLGTVVHDAVHQVGHSNPVINRFLGHGSAMFLGFSFPVFRQVHLQHHGHVNDPKQDPDHFVATGGPLWLIPMRFFYYDWVFFWRRLGKPIDVLSWLVARLLLVGIVLVAAHYGYLTFVLRYWFLPAMIVGFLLGLFFVYLPHMPFHERDRWLNGRVYPSRLLNWLILGQNYHLVHHLWPCMPWYHYQTAYYATQPLLDQKGCEQSLGLLDGRNLGGFLYDLVLGIHLPQRDSIQQPEAKNS